MVEAAVVGLAAVSVGPPVIAAASVQLVGRIPAARKRLGSVQKQNIMYGYHYEYWYMYTYLLHRSDGSCLTIQQIIQLRIVGYI